MVPVMGVDALEMPLAMVAHRPELVAALLGIETPFAGLQLSSDAGGCGRAAGPSTGRGKKSTFRGQIYSFSQQSTDTHYASTSRSDRRIYAAREQGAPSGHWGDAAGAYDPRCLAPGYGGRPSRRTVPTHGKNQATVTMGETTVLGQTLRTLRETSVTEILVVSGHDAARVEAVAAAEDAQTVYNPDYGAGEMLSSLQTVVRALSADVEAVLVVLADQPMVPAWAIELLLTAYREEEAALIAPTFDGQRGNPVLIDQRFFQQLLALRPGEFTPLAAPAQCSVGDGAGGFTECIARSGFSKTVSGGT